MNLMKFLDIVENGYASKDNPRRIGIFINRSGRNYEMTDGKGKFWLSSCDNERLKVIGNLLDKDAEGRMKYASPIHLP